jgi:Fe-S oxidoreductase
MWMEEKIGQRINHRRVEQLLALRGTRVDQAARGTRVDQVTKVASGCPFCLIMLEEGVGAKGVQDEVKPVDVLELVAARVEGAG